MFGQNMQNVLHIPHYTIEYHHQHEPTIDDNLLRQYDEQGEIIDNFAKGDRKNIFIFCNSGYQRSIPFICYYLIKYHPDEVPNLDKALDIILPQISKETYAEDKMNYYDNLSKLNVF